MKTTHHKVEELIRLEAYLLSEKAGHPHGMDAIFWTQAEEIVRTQSMKVAKPKAAPTKKTTTAQKTARAKSAPTKVPAKSKASAPASAKPKTITVNKTVAAKAKAPSTKKPAAKAKAKPAAKAVAEQGKPTV